MIDFIKKHEIYLYYVAFVGLLISFLVNLGSHHIFIHTDEARRGLVALEMIMSGNYVTPTLNGEFYYNKPPLYNWVIIAFFKLFGNYSEFTLRLPVVLAIMGYSLTIVYFCKKHFDLKTSLLIGLSFATCGRIIFYDSFLGLIDTSFSWIIYTSIMIVYHAYDEKKYYKLFLLAYALTAIGFLMKGLPAIAYQGITILAFFIYKRDFRRLFSIQHIIGGALFLLILGAYYLVYFQYNPDSGENVLSVIWSESAKRTGLKFGFWNVVLQFLSFPFDTLKHFAPWTLFVILFLRKDLVQVIKSHPFITFNALMFLANILPYWTSPQVYPRYLFVFVPLANTVAFYFLNNEATKKWQEISLSYIFGVAMILVTIALTALYFVELPGVISYLYLKVTVVITLLALVCILYFRLKASQLVLFVIGLAVMRLAFAWFNLPLRDPKRFELKDMAVEVAEMTKSDPLFVYGDTKIHDGTSYFITAERNEVLKRKFDDFTPSETYIISEDKLDSIPPYQDLHTFKTFQFREKLHLIRFDQ